jgi:hypothetical protein
VIGERQFWKLAEPPASAPTRKKATSARPTRRS